MVALASARALPDQVARQCWRRGACSRWSPTSRGTRGRSARPGPPLRCPGGRSRALLIPDAAISLLALRADCERANYCRTRTVPGVDQTCTLPQQMCRWSITRQPAFGEAGSFRPRVVVGRWKTHLAADRTSCYRAAANQMRLFLHLGAYWLTWSLRAAMPRRSFWRVAQFDTLRLRLI